MNKITNFLCHKLSPFIFKRRDKKIRKNFYPCLMEVKYENKELLFSSDKILSEIIYKDNHWNHIKYIGIHMWNDLYKKAWLQQKNNNYLIDNECISKKITIEQNKIKCRNTGEKNDWIFLHFNKALNTPYCVEFEAKIEYETSEFQFAFNYQTIGKRYRFNLIKNKHLCFEVLNNGFFHTHIIDVPFSLELNKYYHFEIIISDNTFSYIVDKKTILCVQQKTRIVENGSIAFILWNSEKGEIDTTYRNINIYKLLP